ncbi:2-oxoglutarate dehydrogenase, E2 component, dihydrolipoamide succinyltransferase [Brevibacterium ihuae]|uniref:2-oxoglutarate dehydrogenase, E2 component, dihydrolipoamide succinyltransferase n=1 Tax=Brevibacterium ihuae TaxID=1631743 RepID=UPI000C76353B|nr:2-oxoglutarate dehydrogenase, E2 component, dihydrolipoamide succinyltransferase [Brevibacterium ihuae]
MSNSVQMPALGESVTEGTVTRWLKEVGDEVEVDEPLLEVSTDKVDTEIPSPYAGVLEKILAEEDDVVEVGGDLAVIGDGDSSDDSDSSDDDAEAEDAESSADDESDADATEDAADDGGAADAEAEETDESEDTDAADADAAGEDSAEGSDFDSAKGSDSGSGDSTEVTMPALGESVTEGTVTRWLKEVGDAVEVDEPLLEVSTDKVDTEVPSPVAGTVQKLLADEDDTVEVGEPLAIIGSGSASDDGGDDSAEKSGTDEEPAEEPEHEPETDAEDQESAEPEDKADEAEKSDAEGEEAAKKVDAETDEDPEPDTESDSNKDDSGTKDSDDSDEKESASAKQDPGAARRSMSSAVSSDNAAYVTPLVRKLAKSKGVDLGAVTGTGVGGRIRKQDVLAAAQNAAATQAAGPVGGGESREAYSHEIPEAAQKLRGTTEKATRIRQTIASRMHESLQTSAQLTQVIEVDMTRVAKLRAARKEAFADKHGVKLSFLPFFAKAIVEALQVHPKVNAVYDVEAKEITYFDHENLAVAVDTERGLLVPVIKDAGELSVAGIAKAIDDIAERTRNSKIGPDELTGGTFTVTNIGSVGALFDTPIINTPQVGIIGTGVITKRPVVVKSVDGEDTIAIRDMVYLPLTYNHQLVDGADAGRFLQTIKARLEDGNFEADLDL